MNAARSNTVPPALLWTTGFAVIGFCAASIVAFALWVPDSMGDPRASVMDAASPAEAAQARVRRAARATPVQAASRGLTETSCAQCGIIESMREVQSPRDDSGRGAAGGSGVKSTSTFQITIRFADGTTSVINQPDSPMWRNGDQVKLVNGLIEPNA